jgi:DedD protein
VERRVKERLIGASILVVLIVLVVPELLSGPKPVPPPAAPVATPESTRHVTVDLATSKPPANPDIEAAPGASTASALPAPTLPVPTPAATMPAPTVPPSATPESADAAVAPESKTPNVTSHGPPPASTAVESKAASPISTGHGGWAVQLGSFATRANADNLVHQLKAQGFAVYVLSGGSGQSLRHRVRVGPLADRESAERTAAKLKSLGHASSLVAPAA